MNEIEKKNNRIEIILRDIYQSRSKYITTLPVSEGYNSGKYDDLRFGEVLLEEGLVMSTFPPFKLSKLGLEVCEKHDGWLKYLEYITELELEQQRQANIREQLETDLAKSNIEANKLNAKNAEQNSQNESKNRTAMWVNISVGVLNTVLLAIQIWLIARKP